MSDPRQISQRDLRLKSKAIMDAVEAGTSFIVTRDSRPMGQLIPLRRRFVTRAQFAESSRYAANPDLKQFRDDAADYLTADMDDPYDR